MGWVRLRVNWAGQIWPGSLVSDGLALRVARGFGGGQALIALRSKRKHYGERIKLYNDGFVYHHAMPAP